MLDVDVNDGVYVNDERRKFENDSERALSQAQRDHERKQAIHQGVHGENQHTFEQVKVKVPPTLCEPTKEERRSRDATHCPFRAWREICVKAKSPDGKHTKQVGNTEHILVI